MTRFVCRGTAVVVAFLLAGVSTGWCQQYIYAPTAVDTGKQAEKKDGVLVQELQVQKGDTLYGISRKFSGRGMYYPQILLFNELKDPNKIYPGNVLKIPVTRKSQAAAGEPAVDITPVAPLPASSGKGGDGFVATELSTSDLKKTDTGREKKREAKKKSEGSLKKAAQGQSGPEQVKSATSQKLFEQAVKAYRQEDYRSAIELFDRFLSDNPSSSLAPDASLYKAECYLKQSGQ